MATRRRRKNADNDIRKLERRSLDGSPREIADYWLACLRAGELPKHNFYLPISKNKVWTLHIQEYMDKVNKVTWRELPIRVIENAQYPSRARYEVLRGPLATYFPTLKEALELLLAPESTKENPPKHRRKNADDRLRRLERATYDSDPAARKTALLEYWRAMLQAGQVPPPTLEISPRHKLWALPNSASDGMSGRAGPNSHVSLLLFDPQYGAPGAKLTLHTQLQNDRFYGSVQHVQKMLLKFLASLVEDTLHGT